MRYNIRTLSLLIVIFGLLSNGLSQSFFNRLNGSDPYISSGRAFAMGGTSHSENSTHLLLLNPAGLWRLGSGLSFELHQGGSSILERRGFDIKDFFGDYLTTSDYVVNHTYRFSSGFGISGGKEFGSLLITTALSSSPFTSFSYKYIEEVRGKMTFDDGIIGNKDPLLGYHHYEVKGQLNRISLGLGVRYIMDESINLNFGLAYHKIPESSVHVLFSADTLQSMD